MIQRPATALKNDGEWCEWEADKKSYKAKSHIDRPYCWFISSPSEEENPLYMAAFDRTAGTLMSFFHFLQKTNEVKSVQLFIPIKKMAK